MTTFKNDEFFYVNQDRDVTVSITFSAQPNCTDRVVLKNAAEALAFLANNGVHKSWAKKVEIKR